MTEHVCDPTLEFTSDNNPLTRSRAVRLVMAQLDPGTNVTDSVTQLLQESAGACAA